MSAPESCQSVLSYRHLAARWWIEGRGSHGLRCECLPCADLRASLALEGRPLFPSGLEITRVSTGRAG